MFEIPLLVFVFICRTWTRNRFWSGTSSGKTTSFLSGSRPRRSRSGIFVSAKTNSLMSSSVPTMRLKIITVNTEGCFRSAPLCSSMSRLLTARAAISLIDWAQVHRSKRKVYKDSMPAADAVPKAYTDFAKKMAKKKARKCRSAD